MHRRSSLVVVFILLAVLIGCRGPEPVDNKVSLVVSTASVGKELELTNSALRRFMEKNPDISVYVTPTPRTYEERLGLYKEVLSKGSPDVDVFQIDVVWTRTMAPHAYDLNPFFPPTELEKHFPGIIQNNTVDGKLVGIPWFTDAPTLYYRKDLLKRYGYSAPPTTWDELEEMAKKIQDGERSDKDDPNFGFWGYVWQGRAFEVLTCNALEWQSSQGGGNFIDEQGAPSFSNPKALAAFKRAAGWIGTISPPNVVDFDEEDSLLVWAKGDAAFMRNWSYAYALTKEGAIGDKFDVTQMPRGEGGTAAVLGGWQLMVSKYSRHPQQAVRLVEFLTSRDEQKRRAIEGSQNPTLQSLYDDPEVLKAVPFFGKFDETMHNVVARPSNNVGEKYDAVSEAYWTAVHNILTGGDAKEETIKGEEKIREILGQPGQ